MYTKREGGVMIMVLMTKDSIAVSVFVDILGEFDKD